MLPHNHFRFIFIFITSTLGCLFGRVNRNLYVKNIISKADIIIHNTYIWCLVDLKSEYWFQHNKAHNTKNHKKGSLANNTTPKSSDQKHVSLWTITMVFFYVIWFHLNEKKRHSWDIISKSQTHRKDIIIFHAKVSNMAFCYCAILMSTNFSAKSLVFFYFLLEELWYIRFQSIDHHDNNTTQQQSTFCTFL